MVTESISIEMVLHRIEFEILPHVTRDRNLGKVISVIEGNLRMKIVNLTSYRNDEGITVGVIVEGNNIDKTFNKMVGDSNPEKARVGSIRRMYGNSLKENVIKVRYMGKVRENGGEKNNNV